MDSGNRSGEFRRQNLDSRRDGLIMKNVKSLFRKLFPRCFTALFCVVFAAIGPSLIQAQTIVWEVISPFRFIDYSKSGTEHWAIPFDKSASDFVTELMADANRNNLPPFTSTNYIRDRKAGDTTLFDREYVFPQYVRVTARLLPPVEGECDWTYGGNDGKRGKFKCDELFEFEANTHLNPGPSELVIIDSSSGQVLDKTQVVVKDRLVLGLGDSFGSGQGNPDKPAEADPVKLKGLADKNRNRIINGRWMKIKNAKVNWLKSKAEWLDNQCHRSLFSQHVLTAMRLASTNSKESVTLLPLACSGAEVLDGLLIPQKEPPFGKRPVADSQVNFAIRHLCPSGEFHPPVNQVYPRRESGRDRPRAIRQKLLRCKGGVRTPDAILLSIGGNDVGFAHAIAWAALPYSGRLGRFVTGTVERIFPVVCPSDSTGPRCGRVFPPAKSRISNWLPDYYQYLMDELQASGLVSDPKKVFLTAYPDPTYAKGGNEVCNINASEDALEQMRTMLPSGLRPRTSWDLWFTKDEVKELQDHVIAPLSIAMENAANKHDWTFVNEYLEQIRKDHGLCSGYDREQSACDSVKSEPAPMYPHIRNGCWHPKRPDLEWAYDTSRQRWFRNTNDSILFQFDGTKSSIKGAFHPDFRAHALMADYVFLEVSSRWSSDKRR